MTRKPPHDVPHLHTAEDARRVLRDTPPPAGPERWALVMRSTHPGLTVPQVAARLGVPVREYSTLLRQALSAA
jgi:hypothetical protein